VAGESGGSGYALGIAVFGVLIAVLLYMRCSGDDDPKPTPQTPATTATATASEAAPLPEFAPPPPPEEEEDAGAEDAGGDTPSTGGGKKPVAGGAGPCSNCGKGVTSSALNSAVSSTAGLARGCYQRALRAGGAEGTLVVSVSVGPAGNLCGARITSDSVGNPTISQCVLGKFQSRSYPKPQSGCVVVNVPISFKMKTP
jgi:outer membrane biosynthesis protein TonB